MTDNVDAAVRSRMMSTIRSKDTRPELLLRSGLHRRGLRFRLHDRRLPGSPDIVFPRRRAAVFVHGCFWHGHQGCPYFKIPATRPDFWTAKIQQNRSRDEQAEKLLHEAGWRVAVVWECATRADADATVGLVETWVRRADSDLEVAG